MPKPANIVLVEDNPSDVWALKLAMEDAGITAKLNILSDGEEALLYIEDDAAPIPELLILDLNLPRRSGHFILKRLQESALRCVPVLVVTSSNAPVDREQVAKFTPHYFRKPIDLDEFLQLGTLIKELLRPAHAALR